MQGCQHRRGRRARISPDVAAELAHLHGHAFERADRTSHALDASQLNVAALSRVCRAAGTECVMVFTFETESPDSTDHVRMFAPLLGVPEDPATGSANGGLGAYLVHHQAVPVTEPTTYLLSEQGAEMGRPSTLHVEVDSRDEETTAVRVGGQVVPVAEGIARF